jgi:hypothetical protein
MLKHTRSLLCLNVKTYSEFTLFQWIIFSYTTFLAYRYVPPVENIMGEECSVMIEIKDADEQNRYSNLVKRMIIHINIYLLCMTRYSWNTAEIGIKHQSINQLTRFTGKLYSCLHRCIWTPNNLTFFYFILFHPFHQIAVPILFISILISLTNTDRQ